MDDFAIRRAFLSKIFVTTTDTLPYDRKRLAILQMNPITVYLHRHSKTYILIKKIAQATNKE